MRQLLLALLGLYAVALLVLLVTMRRRARADAGRPQPLFAQLFGWGAHLLAILMFASLVATVREMPVAPGASGLSRRVVAAQQTLAQFSRQTDLPEARTLVSASGRTAVTMKLGTIKSIKGLWRPG